MPNSTSLHAKLLGDLAACAPPRAAPSTTSVRSGWRSLQTGRRPRLAAQARRRGERPRSRRAARGRARSTSGQPREVHRLGPVGHEVAPEVVGDERHQRRDHAQRLDERVPERLERLLLAVPEAPPRAADVPVREVVERTPRRRGSRSSVTYASYAASASLDERVRALDEPAVERAQVAAAARAPSHDGLKPEMFA